MMDRKSMMAMAQITALAASFGGIDFPMTSPPRAAYGPKYQRHAGKKEMERRAKRAARERTA